MYQLTISCLTSLLPLLTPFSPFCSYPLIHMSTVPLLSYCSSVTPSLFVAWQTHPSYPQFLSLLPEYSPVFTLPWGWCLASYSSLPLTLPVKIEATLIRSKNIHVGWYYVISINHKTCHIMFRVTKARYLERF